MPINEALRPRIVEIAQQRLRLGYRRIDDLLRSDDPGPNYERVYRLYRAALSRGDQKAIRSDGGPEFTGLG